jgi:hypothetical protein
LQIVKYTTPVEFAALIQGKDLSFPGLASRLYKQYKSPFGVPGWPCSCGKSSGHRANFSHLGQPYDWQLRKVSAKNFAEVNQVIMNLRKHNTWA